MEPPEASLPPSLGLASILLAFGKGPIWARKTRRRRWRSWLSFPSRGSPLPLLFLTQGFPPSAPSAAGLLESDLGSHRVDAVISPDGRCGCYRSTHPPRNQSNPTPAKLGLFGLTFVFASEKLENPDIHQRTEGEGERERKGCDSLFPEEKEEEEVEN